jgi:glucose-6-phosphate isomerase/transaldolase/glucose-6-phosphate isomerase
MSDLIANLTGFRPQVEHALAGMRETRLLERLWNKDHRLWKPEPAEITNRLGWLTVAREMQTQAAEMAAFAQSIRQEGFRDVVLLGMGGSSLGPEVLRHTFPSAAGYPRLHVLDSTVPGAVRAVTRHINLQRTLFIVASKSGGTIEVMSLFAYFWRAVTEAGQRQPGQQFIAITDPETSLGALARDRGFRRTFINPEDIGGRYSVLSYFGLVPAALMGIQVDRLLDRAVAMEQACGPTTAPEANPGAVLGAAMGLLAQAGRDKITVLASPGVDSFGLWAEQLIAESTGKEHTGLIPVAQEPFMSVSAYGDDRLFVVLRLDRDANQRLDRHVSALKRAQQPIIELRLRNPYDLAGEFFRWEFATAVAGHFLGINPFDQPNVQESKDNTKRILEEVKRQGRLPDVENDTTLDGLLSQAEPGQYFTVLAYVTPSKRTDAALNGLRKIVMTKYRIATTAAYGPRYLHSTGQLHKGGPKRGLFLELIEKMDPDLAIPEAPYTFGTLAQAQAIGDIQSLRAHGRPAANVWLREDPALEINSLTATRRRPAGSTKSGPSRGRGGRGRARGTDLRHGSGRRRRSG